MVLPFSHPIKLSFLGLRRRADHSTVLGVYYGVTSFFVTYLFPQYHSVPFTKDRQAEFRIRIFFHVSHL